MIGDSGTGKSHLLIGLGTRAAEAGYRVRYTLASKLVNELVEAADDRHLTKLITRYGRVDLLLIDELGYLQLDRRGAELLFQVLTEREERSAIAIASNEPFSAWTKPSQTPALRPRSSTASPSPARSSKPAPTPTDSPTPETPDQPKRLGPNQAVLPGPTQVDIATEPCWTSATREQAVNVSRNPHRPRPVGSRPNFGQLARQGYEMRQRESSKISPLIAQRSSPGICSA